jgi:hypothetical protein
VKTDSYTNYYLLFMKCRETGMGGTIAVSRKSLRIHLRAFENESEGNGRPSFQPGGTDEYSASNCTPFQKRLPE